MTEVVPPDVPQAKSAEIKTPFFDEFDGLLSRGRFKAVKKAQIFQNFNILSYKYGLATKYDESVARSYNARSVLGGHRDRSETFIVDTFQTVQNW